MWKICPLYQKNKSDILTKEKFDNLNEPISDKYKEIGHNVVFLNIILIIWNL